MFRIGEVFHQRLNRPWQRSVQRDRADKENDTPGARNREKIGTEGMSPVRNRKAEEGSLRRDSVTRVKERKRYVE